MSEPSREDLEDRVAELESTLEELREHLEPARGPFGLPRPPGPRELLRFADEAAIPAAVAVLEANIRTLELLQRAIRLADRERTLEDAGDVGDRATALTRGTLDRLDRALADLGSAVEGGGRPPDPAARELLRTARALNEEIRERVGDRGSRGDADQDGREGSDPEVTESPRETDVEIDVDAEIESIKEEMRDGAAEDGGGSAGDRVEDQSDGDESNGPTGKGSEGSNGDGA